MSFDRHLAEIAREFPDWTIWRSDAGRWWATRHHPLTAEQRDAGYAMTVDADDPEGLRAQLRHQEGRAAPAGSAAEPAPVRPAVPEETADPGPGLASGPEPGTATPQETVPDAEAAISAPGPDPGAEPGPDPDS